MMIISSFRRKIGAIAAISHPISQQPKVFFSDLKLEVFLVILTLGKDFWARVIRKYFNCLFRYLNLIFEIWNWKLIKNTWSTVSKILEKKILKFKLISKLIFSNETINIFEAFKLEFLNSKCCFTPVCASKLAWCSESQGSWVFNSTTKLGRKWHRKIEL